MNRIFTPYDWRFTGMLLFAWFGLCTLGPAVGWAFMGDDLEKPKPEFTRSADQITAKLIPRAKSTSISIAFKVAGGRMEAVSGVDFASAARPEVDVKNFKSALFEIIINEVPVGGEAQVSIISDFFTRATAFYVFNAKLEVPWADSGAENRGHPDRVQELIVKVKDGGPFDSDGAADGRISLVGGPRDSFWGYALGTLFIRFFGIFIVLSILMIGIMFSGKVFQLSFGKKKIASDFDQTVARGQGALTAEAQRVAVNQPAPAAGMPAEEDVAAIALALHLHLAPRHTSEPRSLLVSSSGAWTINGRNRMMSDRFPTFNRSHRQAN
ncbi:MAG: OadG family protein [Desulfobacterales bacterium]|nr:MAG: OadG family protein [Desulfobacterales bacterium]